MQPDSALVEMFRGVRQDARADPTPTEISAAFPIDIGFDGAGLLPVIGSVMILPLGNLKARITAAVIVANGIGSATIDLRLGTITDVPVLTPISRGGVIPTLVLAASTPLDISTWTTNLQPSDVLIATLLSASGSYTCVTLSLHCRRLKWPAGTSTLTDGSGNTFTTTGGATVTYRS
jgi:hypothetical protein